MDKKEIYKANKEYYNQVAEFRASRQFTHRYNFEGKITQRRIRSIFNLNFREGDKWLDMGCAGGNTLHYISMLLPEIRLKKYGIDLAEKNIEIASEQYKDVYLRVGNVEELPYKNKEFDIVTYMHVIEHVPDPVKSLKELKRVLKDKGEAMFSFQNKYGLETFGLSFSKKYLEWLLGGDTAGYSKGKNVLDTRRSIKEIEQMCKEAGLKIEKMYGNIFMVPSLFWRIKWLRPIGIMISDMLEQKLFRFASYISVKVKK